MSGESVESGVCRRCGAPLPTAMAGSVCARCALQDALASPPDPTAAQGLFLDDLPAEGETCARLGPFELLEPLAQGGMGIIYKARQPALNRIVAVKVLLGGEHASPEFKRRFRQEAEAIARLQHPNIVTAFDIGEHHGTPYFAMEYIEGQDLDRLVREGLPTPRRAAEWVQSAAETIAFAHRHSIWHRDLKPSNLLLGDDGRIRIGDFGLARLPEEQTGLTRTGQAMGSPGFLPPEQVSLKRGAVGPHSDVYSLGAVLYFLLAGRAPFLSGNAAEAFEQVLHAEPVSLRGLNSAVPVSLETIAFKCLEKDPTRRYASAQDLAEDLGRFLRGEPIHARPASTLNMLVKWARRKPTVAGLSGALAAVLFVAGGTSLWQWRQVRTANDQLKAQLVRGGLERAEEEFGAGQPRRAIAQLIEAVRLRPHDRVAVTRLMSALMGRSYLLPRPLPGPSTNIVKARLSPDGSRLLTISAAGQVSIWDTGQGHEPVASWDEPFAVADLGFSGDGRCVYTVAARPNAEGGFAAQVWDSGTGKPRGPPLAHVRAPVAVRFSPDALSLSVLLPVGEAVRWDVATGGRASMVAADPAVQASALSPDGRWLATLSSNRIARVWDLGTAQPVGAGWTSSVPAIALAFNDDGTRLAAADLRQITVWESPSGRLIAQTNGVGGDFVAFNRPGDRLMVAVQTGVPIWTARLLEPSTLAIAGTITNIAMRQSDPFAAGTGLITGFFGQLVRVYSDRDGAPVTDPFECGRLPSEVVCSADGSQVALVTHEEKLMGFSVRPSWGSETMIPTESSLQQVALSQDGTLFACRSTNAPVEIRETTSGKLVGRTPPLEAAVTALALSRDHALLAVGTADGRLVVWDVKTGEPAGPPSVLPHGPTQASFSSDGRQLLAVTPTGLHVVDWASPQTANAPLPLDAKVAPPVRWSTPLVRYAEFSPDDGRVIAGCFYGGAQVWDTVTRRVLFVLEHNAPVFRAHFSRDGRRMITAGSDGTARVWAGSNAECVLKLPHGDSVTEALFTDADRLVVTVGIDHVARVWDASTGARLGECPDQGDQLLDAIVSPRGTFFATVAHDGRLRVWDTGTCLAVSEECQRAWKWPRLAFLPEDRALAYYGASRGVQRIDLGPWPLPCPDWLPKLAEAVTQYTFAGASQVEPVPIERFLQLRERIRALPRTDPYTRWAQWFLGDQ